MHRRRRNLIAKIFPVVLSGGGLTPDAAFRAWLYSNYGLREYPMDEQSGAAFSGDGLPDGVISGTPTAYAVDTYVPNSPKALETDHNVDVYADGAEFPTLTAPALIGGLFYIDGALDSTGAKTGIGMLIGKAGVFQLYLSTVSMNLTCVVTYSTTNAQTSIPAYTVDLRTPTALHARLNTDNRIDLFVNGLKINPSTQVQGVGTIVSNSNHVYVGSNGGALQFHDGWSSLIEPPQTLSPTMSNHDIYTAFGAGLDLAAPISTNHIAALYTGMDSADVLSKLTPVGTNTDELYVEGPNTYYRLNFGNSSSGISIYAHNGYNGLGSGLTTLYATYLLKVRIRVNGTPAIPTKIAWFDGNTIVGSDTLTSEFVEYTRVVYASNYGVGFLFQKFDTSLDIDYFQAYRIDEKLPADYPYGPKLFDNGADVFASGTYTWNVLGTNTKANVGNALEITYVDNADGAYLTLSAASDLNADLVVGHTYKYEAYAWVNTGSVDVNIYEPTVGVVQTTTVSSTTVTKISLTFTHTANGSQIRMGNMGTGEKIYISLQSLREVL